MKIEIKNRWTAAIIFECEADSLKIAVELAVKQKIKLDDASLDGANLNGANLNGASLNGASLYGASLYGASLNGLDTTFIRDDLWAVLSAAPAEVPGLRQAIPQARFSRRLDGANAGRVRC